MKVKALVVALGIMVLTVGAAVVAQDRSNGHIYEGYTGEVLTFNDPDPMEVESMVATEGTLEAVTADSANWYGQVVTLEGEIGDFVNARIFSLGEGATLDNDQVLVVNNSSHAFPPEVIQEARVRVTGRIHPSRIAVDEGAQTDFGALFTVENANTSAPDTGTTMTDPSHEFNGFYNAWNGMGMSATDNTAADLQTLDTNLDTLTEEQRIQLADAFDQDAANFEANHPTLSQSLRDTATNLRDNDVNAARTGLQATVTELQNQQDQLAVDAKNQAAMMNMTPMARPDMVEWVYGGLVPDGFDNFTILEIFSVDNVTFVDFGQNDIGN